MQPIHELLNRIRWDQDFSRAEFVIGFYDRLAQRIIRVPFKQLYFPPEDHFAFALIDEEGETHQVPYHRVREVYRNGELIWQRHPESANEEVSS